MGSPPLTRAGHRKGVVEKGNHTAAQRWWRTLADDLTAEQAQNRVSFELVSGQRPPASKETRPSWRSHTGWGISVSVSGEFQ